MTAITTFFAENAPYSYGVAGFIAGVALMYLVMRRTMERRAER